MQNAEATTMGMVIDCRQEQVIMVSCSIIYGSDHRGECYTIEHPQDKKFKKRGAVQAFS